MIDIEKPYAAALQAFPDAQIYAVGPGQEPETRTFRCHEVDEAIEHCRDAAILVYLVLPARPYLGFDDLRCLPVEATDAAGWSRDYQPFVTKLGEDLFVVCGWIRSGPEVNAKKPLLRGEV